MKASSPPWPVLGFMAGRFLGQRPTLRMSFGPSVRPSRSVLGVTRRRSPRARAAPPLLRGRQAGVPRGNPHSRSCGTRRGRALARGPGTPPLGRPPVRCRGAGPTAAVLRSHRAPRLDTAPLQQGPYPVDRGVVAVHGHFDFQLHLPGTWPAHNCRLRPDTRASPWPRACRVGAGGQGALELPTQQRHFLGHRRHRMHVTVREGLVFCVGPAAALLPREMLHAPPLPLLAGHEGSTLRWRSGLGPGARTLGRASRAGRRLPRWRLLRIGADLSMQLA